MYIRFPNSFLKKEKKKIHGQTTLDLHSPFPLSPSPSRSSSQSVRSSLSRSTWSTASTSRSTRQKCSCGGGFAAVSPADADSDSAPPPLPLVSAAGAEIGFFAAATSAAGAETELPPLPLPLPAFSVPGAGLECHSLAPGLSFSHADSRSFAARASAARAPMTASVPERRNWDRDSVKYQQASARGSRKACSTLAVLEEGEGSFFGRRGGGEDVVSKKESNEIEVEFAEVVAEVELAFASAVAFASPTSCCLRKIAFAPARSRLIDYLCKLSKALLLRLRRQSSFACCIIVVVVDGNILFCSSSMMTSRIGIGTLLSLLRLRPQVDLISLPSVGDESETRRCGRRSSSGGPRPRRRSSPVDDAIREIKPAAEDD